MNNCHCSVKIKNLQVKKSGHIILNNVTLTANHGETLALIGKNGAGKTTLLKAILHSMDFRGKIDFFDSKGNKISNPKIGYVPQRLSIDRNTPITVSDLFCANSSNLPVWIGHSKSKIKKAEAILEKVGAKNLISKSIGKLSGGELQRILLAFALEPMPDILLLDEPVSAMDPDGAQSLYKLVNEIHQRYGTTIIAVEHRVDYLLPYVTDMLVLKQGELVAADRFEAAAPKMYEDPELRPLLPALWQVKLGLEEKLGLDLGDWRREEDALLDFQTYGIVAEGRAD